MDYEEIVIEVLSSMANGQGEAHSVDLLFTEVLQQHSELIGNQSDIRKTISNLIQKGSIVYDEKMPNWIRLNKQS